MERRAGGSWSSSPAGEPESSGPELRGALEEYGLEAGRLEAEGRLRIIPEGGRRTEALRRLLKEEAGSERTVWASFDWTEAVNLATVLEQQEEMAELVGASRELVVKTALLEEVSDAWPVREQRRARTAHAGTLWLSERGLALSRFVPLSRT